MKENNNQQRKQQPTLREYKWVVLHPLYEINNKYSQKAEHFGVFALLSRPTKKNKNNKKHQQQQTKKRKSVAFPTKQHKKKQTTKTKKRQLQPPFVFLSRKMMPAFGAGCQQRRPTKPQFRQRQSDVRSLPRRGVFCC